MPESKPNQELQGQYILDALEKYSLNGDAYLTRDKLLHLCVGGKKQLCFLEFIEDFDFLVKEGYLVLEDGAVYLQQILQYENYTASKLAALLQDIESPAGQLPKVMHGNGNALTAEQRNAVQMALSNRLSIVPGGAGTGKTTLIEALVKYGASVSSDDWFLCAPTGKAARNLTERSRLEATTLHSALGTVPGDDFLSAYELSGIRLIVVDEASMLTLEMLAGLLKAANHNTRIVLVGDPNQLLSVGVGNVLPDLLELQVPSVLLTTCHRQSGAAGALLDNVQRFNLVQSLEDLMFDDGFQFQPKYSIKEVSDSVCNRAAALYRQNLSVQVLSPYNEFTELSVNKLNKKIQDLVNPLVTNDESRNKQLRQFRNGDRVMLKKNDKQRDVCNGDIGTLYIRSDDMENPEFSVCFPDGRSVAWNNKYGLSNFSLAYAITVHKSQGSEYAEVIMPLIEPFALTLNRNLVYTAVSRARKRVTLIGSAEVMDKAIKTMPQKRLSRLVEKTLSQASDESQFCVNRYSRAG